MILERVASLDAYLAKYVTAGIDQQAFNTVLAAGVAQAQGELVPPGVYVLDVQRQGQPDVMWLGLVLFREAGKEERVTVLYLPTTNVGSVFTPEMLALQAGESLAANVTRMFDEWLAAGRNAGHTPGTTTRQ